MQNLDYQNLPESQYCAKNFYIKAPDYAAIDVSKIVWSYNNTRSLSYQNFKDATGKCICGSYHYPSDSWDLTEQLAPYLYDVSAGDNEYTSVDSSSLFIARGSHPSLVQHGDTFGPGKYTLRKSGKNLVLKQNSTTKLTIEPAADGVLPSRIIVCMQAGGGGGGASSGGEWGGAPTVGIPAPISGTDGGGGGSGGCFYIIINTLLLSESSSYYYTFNVGSGGAGGGYDPASAGITASQLAAWLGIGAGTVWWFNLLMGESGKEGGASYVSYYGKLPDGTTSTKKLITAEGGKGGGRGAPVGGPYGSGGAGGAVTPGADATKNIIWWTLPLKDSSNGDAGEAYGEGKKGGQAKAGTSTSSYKCCSSYDPEYQLYCTSSMGGYKGGSAGSNASGGGAASFFGNGGNGGGTASGGGAGSGYGAGGGGGRWTAYAYMPGGNGSNGFLRIYY